MTRELSALKPAGLQLLIGAIFLGGLALLGLNGAAWLFVPSPDDTVAEMLRALSAHREPAAGRAMTRELQAQVTPDQLPRLGTVSWIDVETIDDQPDRATVRATVQSGIGEVRAVELPLVKEDGLWRVAAVEPLLGLLP